MSAYCGRKAGVPAFWERDGERAHTDEVDAEAKEAEIIAAELPLPASRRAAHGHAGARRRLCGLPERRQDHAGGEGHFPSRRQRGVRVGSIKHHGHKGFDIDQPGKDSWRHAQAGSRHVGLISPDMYAEYSRTTEEVPVLDMLTRYTDVDTVIVEGYKAAGLPSIVVARSGIDRMRGRDSFELVNEDTIAVACNDVVARDFRTRAVKQARAAAEEAGARASPRRTSICRRSSTSTTRLPLRALSTTTCKRRVKPYRDGRVAPLYTHRGPLHTGPIFIYSITTRPRWARSVWRMCLGTAWNSQRPMTALAAALASGLPLAVAYE